MGYLIFFCCYRLFFLIGLCPMLVYVIPSGLRFHGTNLLSHEVATYISEAVKPLALKRIKFLLSLVF